MKKIFFIIFSVLWLNLSAQSNDTLRKQHEFSLGAGYLQTMSSAFLPFGLSAVNISSDYQYFKQDKKHNKNYWGYWLKTQFAFLQTNVPNRYSTYHKYYLPQYYRTELKTGGAWLRKMPIKSDKFRLFVGAGVSLNTEINFAIQNKQIYTRNIPDLNWFISPDLHIKAEYNLKKIQLKGEILLPLAMVGNYTDKYRYTLVGLDTCETIKSKLTPNKISFLVKNFQPSVSLSAKIPLNKKENAKKQWFLLIKYAFESLDINYKNFTEKKEQHDLRFGFVCEM